MALETVKRIAGRLFKTGGTRVKILDVKAAQEALTSEDVRQLVKDKKVVIAPKMGVSRVRAQEKAIAVQKGRRRGPGSMKGSKYSRQSAKERWIEKIRAQRELLAKLKPALKEGQYRRLYYMIKGNAFKSSKQLQNYVQENKLLK